jgi:hypothetical protein
MTRSSSEPALTPIRHARRRRGPRDLADLVVELLDVARVHPYGRAPGVDRGEHVLGLEVDVGDDRDLGLGGDRREGVGVVLGGHGHAHDLAAGGGQLGDLLQGRVDVGGHRRRHRLHRDRRVPADRHRPHHDLPGPASLRDGTAAHGGDAEINRSHCCTLGGLAKSAASTAEPV